MNLSNKKIIPRYLEQYIAQDLEDKMVFIGGPRQVGKTTLALIIGKKYFKKYQYLNWDNLEDKKKIINTNWEYDTSLIILDEIHKYKNWKNFIKGQYDTKKEYYQFIITGSSRLNIYRRGGDSLQGRYYYYTLFPFTLRELMNVPPTIKPFEKVKIYHHQGLSKLFEKLYTYGGFPEPLQKESLRFLRRFHNDRLTKLINEDIRDFTNLINISKLELLALNLPSRVASPLSISSLAEDLEIDHKTASHWLNVLEYLYHTFRIPPYHHNILRAVKKMAKFYLWDWSEIEDEGKRFENMVAVYLLRLVTFLEEYEGYKTKLYYLRNKDGKEIDFLVVVNSKPWFLVEVKASIKHKNTFKKAINSLHYFKERLNIPYLYLITKESGINFVEKDVAVLSGELFLSGLV